MRRKQGAGRARRINTAGTLGGDRVRLFATPWTVAHQAPLSKGFSRQESWSGLPFPSPGDLPGPGIEPRSPALRADALTSEPQGKPIDGDKTLETKIWRLTEAFTLLFLSEYCRSV